MKSLAFESNSKIPAERLGAARVRLAYGRACEVEHADRSMRVDLPVEDGGGATGPHPSQLMRASLGACLVLGYRDWAARLGVPLDDATLELTCEYDPRPPLAAGSPPLTWQRIRFDVTLTSAAPEAALRELVEVNHRHSPMLALLADRVARELRVHVVRPASREP